jgi:hypothetical protein
VERLVRTNTADLRAEILANRERMLAAREASGALPDDLNDRTRAFQESRVILTALELDLFTAVAGGTSAEMAAARMKTDPRATEMLLNALAAIGLLVKQDGVFRNTVAAEHYFCATSPDNVRPALLHIAHLWPRWSALTECVRAGAAVEPHAEGGVPTDEWIEPFIAAMHRNATERTPHVVRAVGTAGIRRMLDVGGGSGAYSIAFAKANPALRADILDLAAVVPIAQLHIEQAGVADRVTVRVGDLRSDPLDRDYDWRFCPRFATCCVRKRIAICCAGAMPH